MGIHFVCHHCSYALHVKDFQAGKRGKCPNCRGSFRIPANDSSYSSPIEEGQENPVVATVRNAFEKANKKAKADAEPTSTDSIAIAIEPNPIAKSGRSDLKKADSTSSQKNDAKTLNKESKTAVDSQETGVETPMSSNTELVSKLALPASLNEPADAKWFVRPPSGGQFGPAPSQLLMTWISESRVTAESYLWRECFEDWQLASELVPELFGDSRNPNSAPLSSNDIFSDSKSMALSGTEFKTEAADTVSSGLMLKKQLRKRRQQLISIVILAIVSLILLGILIFVLVFQTTKSPQPTSMHVSSMNRNSAQ